MGTKLIVRNLTADINCSDLEGMFMTVGDVIKAAVSMDSATGQSRGIGHVEMTTNAEAVDAIDRFHGMPNNGKILSVSEDRPHVPGPVPFPPKKPKSLFGKKKAKAQ